MATYSQTVVSASKYNAPIGNGVSTTAGSSSTVIYTAPANSYGIVRVTLQYVRGGVVPLNPVIMAVSVAGRFIYSYTVSTTAGTALTNGTWLFETVGDIYIGAGQTLNVSHGGNTQNQTIVMNCTGAEFISL